MSQEVNAVNVYSIDEERLRYRIIVAVTATGIFDFFGEKGEVFYQIDPQKKRKTPFLHFLFFKAMLSKN